jgi:hypothetical protein
MRQNRLAKDDPEQGAPYPKVELLHRRKLLKSTPQTAICAVQRASACCFLDVSSLNLAAPHGAAFFFAFFCPARPMSGIAT